MSTKEQIKAFLRTAIQEDIGDGDHTSLSTIPTGQQGKARLLVKQNGIIAGVSLSKIIFQEINPKLELTYFIQDGAAVTEKDIVLEVQGSIHSILQAERLVLNIMQRMSGIATYTHLLTDQLKGGNTKLLDTRKTTPGFRWFEKEAVRIGGGTNHRFGLFDMILIKDNHVDYAGGVPQALKAAKKYLQETGRTLAIEIEARTMDEVRQVLAEGGIQRIMLDNFSPEQVKEALKVINGQLEVELSGGITEATIAQYAHLGADYISIGSLTHSYKSLDLSLKAF